MTDRSPLKKISSIVILLLGVLAMTSCDGMHDEATPESGDDRSALTITANEIQDPSQDYKPVRYYNDDAFFSVTPPMGLTISETGDGYSLSSMVDPSSSAEIQVVLPEPPIEMVGDNNPALIDWLGENEIGEITFEETFTTEQGLPGKYSVGVLNEESDSGMDGWAAAGIQADTLFYMILSIYPEQDSDQFLDAFQTMLESFRLESDVPLEFPRENALVLAGGEPLTLDPALTHFGSGGMIGDIFSGLVPHEA